MATRHRYKIHWQLGPKRDIVQVVWGLCAANKHAHWNNLMLHNGTVLYYLFISTDFSSSAICNDAHKMNVVQLLKKSQFARIKSHVHDLHRPIKS